MNNSSLQALRRNNQHESNFLALTNTTLNKAANLDASKETAAELTDPSTWEDRIFLNPNQQQSIGNTFNSLDGTTWMPSTYPNPVTDPDGCGISSLANSQIIIDKNAKPLLFCDPDHILEEGEMLEIATSLRDPPLMEVPAASQLSSCPGRSVSTTRRGGEQEKPLGQQATSMFKLSDINTESNARLQATKASFRLIQDSAANDGSSSGSDNVAMKKLNYVEMQVAVAIVSKLNLQSVFLDNSWHSYQDQADVFNDATQYFSRYLFEQWIASSSSQNSCSQLGILIFVSVKDLTCYIVSGAAVESVIPWWRMEYIANEIKAGLKQRQNYGKTLLGAISDLRILAEMGPPSVSDRIGDFLKRFGAVVGFSLFAFICAFGSEYGDRIRRWHIIEKRSKLNSGDKIRAMSLQEEFHCTSCPICLEEFPSSNYLHSKLKFKDSKITLDTNMEGTENNGESVPLFGNDGLPLKLLRCGHAFDFTCWKCWVEKGNGDPFKCPVCRQDIGSPTGTTKRELYPNSRTSLNSRSNNHPDYESVTNSRFRSDRQYRQNTPAHLQHLRTSGTLRPISGVDDREDFAFSSSDIPV